MIFYLFIFFFCSVAIADPSTFKVSFINDVGFATPDFQVFLDGKVWFRSGELGIRDGGNWWSAQSKNEYALYLSDHDEEVGSDPIGPFQKYKFTWTAYSNSTTPTKVKIETAVLVYSYLPVAVFDIVYLTGLTDASISDTGEGVVSSYPSFIVEDGEVEKGWMTWSGNMAAITKYGKWSASEKVYGSIDGGFPLVVFDSKMENAVVVSPLNSFMSAGQASFTSTDKHSTLAFGPLGSIETIPAGYRYRTIMVAGGNVTSAMRRYGEILRTIYRKDDSFRKSDYSINYLGYWTDNGACYYYYTGKNYTNYEDLLVAVKEDADSNGLPFRYVQLDSWWYYKGKEGGVKNWTARPDIFPNGIQSMVKKTGWPVVAHNRFWSPDTDYANQFKFIIEEKSALPTEPAFWDYLMSSSLSSWKLMVYEQDWLDDQVSSLKALRTELGLGEKWLMDMGASAQRYGITIQYCMPWPRHVLQSVMIPTVTQIRVSDDYSPSNEQWVVGDTTILAHAVGLAAFKDNFRSSSTQSDCASKYHTNESYPVLETYVASFTGGPVGPSDMIGTADKTLIMATCMIDGRLLKPTHPAMSLDSTFLQRAFSEDGPTGQMSAAFTEIDGMTWYYVMAAELKADYALSAAELPPSRTTFPAINSIAFQYDVRTGRVFGIEDFSNNSITVEKCGKEDFKYIVIAPLFVNGMALFGELNKFVTVSETRFPQFDATGNSVFATVRGVPSERVTVTVYNGYGTVTVDCAIGDSGYADLTIAQSPTCV